MPAPRHHAVPAPGAGQPACQDVPAGGTRLPAARAGDTAAAGVSACVELLRAKVIRTLREHVGVQGRCPACGDAAWPCERALLAEINVGLVDGAVPQQGPTAPPGRDVAAP